MSEIFKAYQDNGAAIRAILSRYIRRPEVVEELAQETFLRAFAAEVDEDIREPKAYLLRVARNLGLSEVKKHGNAFTDSLEDFGGLEVLKDEGRVSAEDEFDSKRKFLLLCEAIAKLPPEYRRPFLLRKMENLNFKQIAKRLNLTAGTAQKRVARALILCKAYLRERGYSDAELGVRKTPVAYETYGEDRLENSRPQIGPVEEGRGDTNEKMSDE